MRNSSIRLHEQPDITSSPKLLEKGLWQIGSRIVLSGRGIVAFIVFVDVPFVDTYNPWLISCGLVTSHKPADVELHIWQLRRDSKVNNRRQGRQITLLPLYAR